VGTRGSLSALKLKKRAPLADGEKGGDTIGSHVKARNNMAKKKTNKKHSDGGWRPGVLPKQIILRWTVVVRVLKERNWKRPCCEKCCYNASVRQYSKGRKALSLFSNNMETSRVF